MITKTDRDIENEDFAHWLNAGLVGSSMEVIADKDDRFMVVTKGLDRHDLKTFMAHVHKFLEQRKR